MNDRLVKTPFRFGLLMLLILMLSVVSLQSVTSSSQLLFDHFDGTALDMSRWTIVDGGSGMSVFGSLFQTSGGPDHKRINSIDTFAPNGHSVRCRARIRLGGDYQKFGFNVNFELPGPSGSYYFDTFDSSLGANENTIRVLAYSMPSSGPAVGLLSASVPVTWYEFHEFSIERTPAEVIFSIDNHEVARVADTNVGTLPVGVWNDRSPLMQTDWVEVSEFTPGCAPPPAGMVAWWPGDGNANDIVGGNDGTLVNGAVFAAGMVGQAFSFDGFDDYLDTGKTVLGTTGPFTVDAWINTNAIGTYQSIVSEIGSENSVGQFQFRLDVSGILQFFRRFSPGFAITLLNTNQQITPGVWTHVAAVFNGSDLKVYINGIEAPGQTAPSNYGTIFPGTTKVGGADPVGAGQPGGYFFNGLLDEVEIFDRALTPAEIQDLFNAGSGGKCKNRAPVAVCRDVTVSAGPNCTANASIDNGSFDPDGGDTIALTQSPAGPYVLGTTLVTLTVTDNHGASSQCTGTVTVVDDTPPAIGGAAASPSVLWPPNHKMVDVTISYNASDTCGPVSCSLSVTSNEPVNGSGDGDTAPDWEVVDAHHVRLRAERAGAESDRVYTITITCTDGATNTTSQTVTVSVPHDKK